MKRKTPCEVYRERMRAIRQAHDAGQPQQASDAVQRLVGHDWCPDCGAPMQVKVNRRTNQPFLGCSKYPDCKGTRQYRR